MRGLDDDVDGLVKVNCGIVTFRCIGTREHYNHIAPFDSYTGSMEFK